MGKFLADFLLRLVERRREKKRKKREAASGAATEGAFQYDEGANMEAIKGAFISKLVWLGVGQVVWGFIEAYLNGTLTAESAAKLVTGGLTIVFRAVTTQSLAEKSK